MNLWFVSAHDQPRGVSSRTYDYCRQLLARGHRVTMFTNGYDHWTHQERLLPGEPWRVEEVDGIRVIWLRTVPYQGNGLGRGVNMISNAWQAMRVARVLPDRPDVVVGPSVPLATGWAAARIASRTGARFVFEVRDVWPQALVDDGGMSRYSPVYFVFRALEKWLYRRAHRISAVMPFVHRHVAASGCSPEKVTWIPNGVDIELFAGTGHYAGGSSSNLVAMYVGGFGAAHDVISIVRAARILKDKGLSTYRFVIVGNGPKRPECIREAAELGLTNVEFRDPVPKSEVPRLLEESDILLACVLDSPIYRFGLNLNKVFDYFGAGRPVIFAGNAPNDPIAASGAGFSIPPQDPGAMADALARYAQMPAKERVGMGLRGRAYVEKEFDIRMLARKMEAFLLDAAS